RSPGETALALSSVSSSLGSAESELSLLGRLRVRTDDKQKEKQRVRRAESLPTCQKMERQQGGDNNQTVLHQFCCPAPEAHEGETSTACVP
ncbi:hypothetical protein JOQ06_003838, partial [Pogonophryne albipinna]